MNQTQNGITNTLLVNAFAERGGNNFVSLNWPAGSVVGSLLQVGLSYLNSYATVMEVITTPDFHWHSINGILCRVSFQVGRIVGADLYSACPSDQLPHVIGHSLGGQVAHVIGQTFVSMGGKLDRLVQSQSQNKTNEEKFRRSSKLAIVFVIAVVALQLQLRTQLQVWNCDDFFLFSSVDE